MSQARQQHERENMNMRLRLLKAVAAILSICTLFSKVTGYMYFRLHSRKKKPVYYKCSVSSSSCYAVCVEATLGVQHCQKGSQAAFYFKGTSFDYMYRQLCMF